MKNPEIFYFERLNYIIDLIEGQVGTSVILQQIIESRDLLEQETNFKFAILVDSFLEALHDRVASSSDNEHIYLKAFKTPQILLFENLIQKFPPVSLAQKAINDFIATKVDKMKSITIMDIGIGTGMQVSAILKQICDRNPEIEEITIIGIEPSSKSLELADTNLQKIQNEKLKLNFIKICGFAEEQNYNEIMDQVPNTSDTLIINASFALHHIGSEKKRQSLFKKLKSINPNLLLLSEPNVDHFCPDLKQRFQNCFKFFKMNFEIIDSQNISEDEKLGLKNFFCREIKDIIGNDESTRVEKHTPSDDWIQMLEEANFNVEEISSIESNLAYLDDSNEKYFNLSQKHQSTIGLFAAN